MSDIGWGQGMKFVIFFLPQLTFWFCFSLWSCFFFILFYFLRFSICILRLDLECQDELWRCLLCFETCIIFRFRYTEIPEHSETPEHIDIYRNALANITHIFSLQLLSVGLSYKKVTTSVTMIYYHYMTWYTIAFRSWLKTKMQFLNTGMNSMHFGSHLYS